MHRKWKFWLRGVHQMRDDIIEAISDEDLDYTPGGDNPSWRRLLNELSDVEASYIDSLRELNQTFEASEVDGAESLEDIRSRFAQLDEEFSSLFEDWEDGDFAAIVVRPGDFKLSRSDQFDIYVQAVLIVLAKAVVYLRMTGRTVPASAADWIG